MSFGPDSEAMQMMARLAAEEGGCGELDAAWAEAEAVLPEGWAIDSLVSCQASPDDSTPGWIVRAAGDYNILLDKEPSGWSPLDWGDDGTRTEVWAPGKSPIPALRALAVKLREGRSG